MKKIFAAVVLALTSLSATAQVYVELGVGAVIDNVVGHCMSDYDSRPGNINTRSCSDNPLGLIAVGYQYKDFSVVIEHKSSLVEKDRGLDTVFVKYRYTFD